MTANQPQLSFTTFKEVVQHYERYLGKMKCEGGGNLRKIRGFFPAYDDYIPYFGIRNKKNVLIIEFGIERGKNTLLHTIIRHKEYWEEVSIYGRKIECNSRYSTGGHLSIKCDYFLSTEKLCAYINEFIYQVKSRIESIIERDKIKTGCFK
jgi:hypothetical protein